MNASRVSTKRSGTKRGGRCQRRCFLGTSHRRETTGSSRRPQSWEQLRSGHGSLSCFHAARGVCGCLPFMQRHLLRGHVAMQYLGEISQHAAPPRCASTELSTHSTEKKKKNETTKKTPRRRTKQSPPPLRSTPVSDAAQNQRDHCTRSSQPWTSSGEGSHFLCCFCFARARCRQRYVTSRGHNPPLEGKSRARDDFVIAPGAHWSDVGDVTSCVLTPADARARLCVCVHFP